MSIQLQSDKGTEFSMPPRYWSFFLTLASTCEWNAAGTKKPAGLGIFSRWDGNYESTDGQYVTQRDALEFSKALNRCHYSENCKMIVDSVADNLEADVEAETGFQIPDEMKIDRDQVLIYLPEIMAFSYSGGFKIT